MCGIESSATRVDCERLLIVCGHSRHTISVRTARFPGQYPTLLSCFAFFSFWRRCMLGFFCALRDLSDPAPTLRPCRAFCFSCFCCFGTNLRRCCAPFCVFHSRRCLENEEVPVICSSHWNDWLVLMFILFFGDMTLVTYRRKSFSMREDDSCAPHSPPHYVNTTG